MVNCFSDHGAKCNTTTGECSDMLLDDEAPCPPDSVPSDPSVPGSPCQCAPARCVQPVCRFGSTRELRRMGTKTPGDCCDVFECVQPKGNVFHFQNCWTGTVFPSESHDDRPGPTAVYFSELVRIAMGKVRKAPSVVMKFAVENSNILLSCVKPEEGDKPRVFATPTERCRLHWRPEQCRH